MASVARYGKKMQAGTPSSIEKFIITFNNISQIEMSKICIKRVCRRVIV